MSQPRLLTVILNYRTAAMTLKAVEAAWRAMEGIDGEILVVDNDSRDGSVEALREGLRANWADSAPIRLIVAPCNGGFGTGNNHGIRAGFGDGSAPDLIYILNPDAFPAPDAISRLVAHLDAHPTAGCAGSYIHGPEGDAHVTAFRFPSILSEFEGAARFGPVSRLLADRRVPLGVPDTSRPVDWLAGASLMIRRDVLDRIGLFDESFFLYFEETDLCLRAARAGFETHYVRDSHVAHVGSVSTGMKTWTRMPRYWFDSRWHYFRKNYGTGYAALATLAHLCGGLSWRMRRLIQRRPPADPPRFLRDLMMHDLKALLTPASRNKTSRDTSASVVAAKAERIP